MRRVRGVELLVAALFSRFNLWLVALRQYRSPIVATRACMGLLTHFKQSAQGQRIRQAFYMDGGYRWDMYNPPWPSRAFNHFYATQLREHIANKNQVGTVRRVFAAITKKCPLRCAHCSEWDSLNRPNVLSLEEWQAILDKQVAEGVGQILYTGGEPLHRFDDLIALIQRYQGRCDQWIFTSAYNLTEEKVSLLAAKGLNGISISLDHHVASKHDEFRGRDGSFDFALKAIEWGLKYQLAVSLSICPSRTYLAEGQLEHFIALAESLNVPFVNILEPRAVGHFADKDVELSDQGRDELTSWVMQYNSNAKKEKPTVLFPSMFRKKVSCGGGRNYLFIDDDGSLYPCPFCKHKLTDFPAIEDVCLAPELEIQL